MRPGKHTYLIAIPIWDSAIPANYQFQVLANELAKCGHRVVVLIPNCERELISSQANLSVIQWPSKRPTKIKDGIFLYKVIKQCRPDCLIANFAATNWMMLLGWLTGVPVRITWYHTLYQQSTLDFEKKLWDKLKNRILVWRKSVVYKLATQIVPVSAFARKDLQEIYHIHPQKCRVIYNHISIPCTSDIEPLAAESNTLITVGRFDFSKGYDVLIRAMALLREKFPNIHLNMIGDGPQKPELVRLVETLGVENHVTFAGKASHPDVLRQLASSCIMVHPTRMDNCPAVLIESLAVGTPVIASAVGGIPELIRNNIDGLLIEPESPELLSTAIQTVLENRELRNTFSSNARHQFFENFEITKGVEQQIAWLTSIVENQ